MYTCARIFSFFVLSASLVFSDFAFSMQDSAHPSTEEMKHADEKEVQPAFLKHCEVLMADPSGSLSQFQTMSSADFLRALELVQWDSEVTRANPDLLKKIQVLLSDSHRHKEKVLEAFETLRKAADFDDDLLGVFDSRLEALVEHLQDPESKALSVLRSVGKKDVLASLKFLVRMAERSYEKSSLGFVPTVDSVYRGGIAQAKEMIWTSSFFALMTTISPACYYLYQYFIDNEMSLDSWFFSLPGFLPNIMSFLSFMGFTFTAMPLLFGDYKPDRDEGMNPYPLAQMIERIETHWLSRVEDQRIEEPRNLSLPLFEKFENETRYTAKLELLLIPADASLSGQTELLVIRRDFEFRR